MVGVLGPNPSVDTKRKWLIFSHFSFSPNTSLMSFAALLLHFLIFQIWKIKLLFVYLQQISNKILFYYGNKILFKDKADEWNGKPLHKDQPPRIWYQ